MARRGVAVAVAVLGFVVGSAYQNEPEGFRGLAWGSPVPEGWEKVGVTESYGGVEVYVRPGEDLTLGAAKLVAVWYAFWNNRLMTVNLAYEGFVNHDGVLAAATERFGKPYQASRYIPKFMWSGRVTTMLLEYNEVKETGQLMFGSVAVTAQAEAWAKEQAKKGATQF